MSNCAALLDANVLYPAPMRDLLLQLAVAGLFRAKWTGDIHREWIENLLLNEPHRDRAALVRRPVSFGGNPHLAPRLKHGRHYFQEFSLLSTLRSRRPLAPKLTLAASEYTP